MESLDQLTTDSIAEHLFLTQDTTLTEFDEDDFFYFRKFSDGSYKYHLFPELNLRLIENPNFMPKFDRLTYKQSSENAKKERQNAFLGCLSQSAQTGTQFDRFFTQASAFKHETEEMVLVYVTWIYLWCGSFQHLEEGEKTFRVN